MTIFHPHWIDAEKSDEEVVKVAKIVNLIIATYVFGLEHCFISQVQSYKLYTLLIKDTSPSQGTSGLPITTKLLTITAILWVLLLQKKMEEKALDKNINKHIARLVTLSVIVAMSFVFYYLDSLNLSYIGLINFRILLNVFSVSITFSVFPPILVISSHRNLRRFALQKLNLQP